MIYVLDASVAAKWFNLEELSEEAVEAKNAHIIGDLELAAPIQIVYEVGNSIWKNPQIDQGNAEEAIRSFLALHVKLLEPNARRVARTMEIAKVKEITFYDAAYVQAAEEINAFLLSADEKQMAAAEDIVETVHLRQFRTPVRSSSN